MKLIVKRNLYSAILLLSFIATAGSLYFSEVEDLTPCTLCWYQRIFMYPLVILSLVALRRRDTMFAHYVYPLSILGALLAGYQYKLQMFTPNASNIFINCTKGSASCSTIDISYFGFVTIPLLSFVAFLIITVFAFMSLRTDRWK